MTPAPAAAEALGDVEEVDEEEVGDAEYMY